MSGTITILGCGSSGGVPRVGQGWGACDPSEPKNARQRCSILVERRGPGGTTRVLVDMSPDLRQQLLTTGIDALDAIVLTHPHADHVHGIDDVRPLVLGSRRRIEVFMDETTSRDVTQKFAYVFRTPPGSLYPPLLDERRLVAGEPQSFDGAGGEVAITPFRLEHGEIDALGLRIGDVAYTPDLNRIPPESERFLEGLDLWIVDALRYKPHPSHFSLSEALEAVALFAPKRAVLTNLHNDLDYATLRATLPPAIVPAYDGMALPFAP
ncbi:MBL fold metallo-hydrolase [Lichenibacterium ramalinae]|uniref:MBL fold metallo-hydrolase n=1 Tax=Lichenibacterium ramalinae TaxID=2316527 RepID=A0A4Q2RD13_9HYPH|nr:MBL fold metallo-hydrolase [Lichenibacterium ramalinae]RYB05078.1 MBL fold metallo-hydrolase [Lichenibacterium ramalinae]